MVGEEEDYGRSSDYHLEYRFSRDIPAGGESGRSVAKDARRQEQMNGQQTLLTGGMLGDAALGGAAGHGVAQQLAEWINTANTTAYDKAIDSVYLSTHVGGSQLHHLLDGQHDIFGAFDSYQSIGWGTCCKLMALSCLQAFFPARRW